MVKFRLGYVSDLLDEIQHIGVMCGRRCILDDVPRYEEFNINTADSHSVADVVQGARDLFDEIPRVLNGRSDLVGWSGPWLYDELAQPFRVKQRSRLDRLVRADVVERRAHAMHLGIRNVLEPSPGQPVCS